MQLFGPPFNLEISILSTHSHQTIIPITLLKLYLSRSKSCLPSGQFSFFILPEFSTGWIKLIASFCCIPSCLSCSQSSFLVSPLSHLKMLQYPRAQSSTPSLLLSIYILLGDMQSCEFKYHLCANIFQIYILSSNLCNTLELHTCISPSI